MGIFNFFIVIPQILAATLLGIFTKHFFHGNAILTIVDGFGKVVRQKKLNLIPGISELYITIDEATPGVYFLFLYSDTHSYQMKVVVL